MVKPRQITWVYSRDRREFGRYPNFRGEGPVMLYNEGPNEALRKAHIRLEPLCMGTQIYHLWGLHNIETDRVPYKRRNEGHEQGGWPKEVNIYDVILRARYAKKLERDEQLLASLPNLYERCYRWLIQNTSINIYEPYSRKDVDLRKGLGGMSCRKTNLYRDQSQKPRPCICVTFSCDGHRFASAYDDLLFQKTRITDTFSYLWALENPNEVEMVLEADTPAVCMEFNPKDYWALAGGLKTGQVCYWDVRRGSRPVYISPFFDSFRDPVTSIKWINTKAGMDIFSSSSDGRIKWWDLRNPSEPVEDLIVDLTRSEKNSMQNAVGISCLEYDPALPTRFMAGTENGQVLFGNRKAKTAHEKIAPMYVTNKGPVLSLQRNPYLLKYFITCAEWSIKIFAEEFKDSCVMWSKHCASPLTSVAWSPTRYSCFFAARRDGYFEAWDLIDRTDIPIITFKASTEGLRSMSVHPNGYFIAVGSDNGTVSLLEVSKHFTLCDKAEKNALVTMLERETRREKLLESKMKELRLKKQGKLRDVGTKIVTDPEQGILQAEKYFQEALIEIESKEKHVYQNWSKEDCLYRV